MRLRDRDFVETVEGLFFCVVGYLHPPGKYTAYLKYVPAEEGPWGREGVRYRRVIRRYHALQVREAMGLLKSKYPQYVHYCPVRHIEFPMVPVEYVKREYLARSRLREILEEGPGDPLEELLCELVDSLSEATGLPKGSFGVTGSVLIGIHNPSFSDLDLTVYSARAALRLAEALREGVEGVERPPTSKVREWVEGLVKHFGLSPRQARVVAERRWNYMVFRGRYFSVHPIREDYEIKESYGDRVYTPVGVAEGTCVVEDDSESLFLPAVYRVSNVRLESGARLDVREVVSYEGIFSGVVRTGERMFFKGKLERVVEKGGDAYYIVTVGTFEVPDNRLAPLG